MRVSILAILAAILASLACVIQVGTPVPTAAPPSATPSPTPTLAPTPTMFPASATDRETAVVRQFSVYVHAEPDVNSDEVGAVYANDVVTVLECQEDGDFCKIEQPFGWVYRGCLTGFEDGRGCEALR